MAETPLQGQVGIVTGASRGIGAAIARRLAALGAQTILVARDRGRLRHLAAEIEAAGGQALPWPLDITADGAFAALVPQVLERCGRIDILINNAGVGTFGTPLHETAPEVWDATLSTNLRAVYLGIRAVAPHMIARRTGHIINIASLAGHNPVPQAAAYAASKWGLRGLSISVAEELRGHGIRVSLICPGSVDTSLSGAGKDRGRMLHPDDIANAVELIVLQAPRSFVSEVLIRPTLKP